ncbi:MAG: hypothetical protein QF886_26250, partial [Planctomycetota bacterium]|nr:hypothetical protein [Planctomycetota bacterium]
LFGEIPFLRSTISCFPGSLEASSEDCENSHEIDCEHWLHKYNPRKNLGIRTGFSPGSSPEQVNELAAQLYTS